MASKKRYSFKRYKQHGEAQSALAYDHEARLAELQSIVYSTIPTISTTQTKQPFTGAKRLPGLSQIVHRRGGSSIKPASQSYQALTRWKHIVFQRGLSAQRRIPEHSNKTTRRFKTSLSITVQIKRLG